jgi:predicted RNA-binding protein with PUA-like domain
MAGNRSAHAGGWLFKEEPEHYSYADLERDGHTWWDGVNNNLALQNLRKTKAGDRVLYYHTGKEKAVVGEMRVVEGPVPDPDGDTPRSVKVKVEAVKRWSRPVRLEQIKKEPQFSSWELVRLPRLSVLPVSAEQWRRLEQLAGEPSEDS